MPNALDIDVKDAAGATKTVGTMDKLIARIGEVDPNPVANTVQDRLKAIQTALATLHTDLATTLAGYVDGLEGLIGTSNTNLGTLHTDLNTTLAGLITSLNGYVDGLETLTTSSNTKLDTLHTDLATTLSGLLTSLNGYVDGLETLTTSSNTKLDTIHADLGTTLSGLLSDLKSYTDGLETLVTSSNTKLDTLHTDLATTLAGLLGDLKGYTDQLEGYVDGLETLVTSTNTKLDTVHADLIAATPAGRNTIGAFKTRLIIAAASAMTRPANTTPYTAGDAVSNNGTAGSVTPITFTVSDTNNDPISLESMLIDASDTGVQGKNFRAWLFNADPTANSGVGAGDNGVWSQKRAGFIGTMVGSFKTFSDGACAVLVPEDGIRIITTPVSGAMTVHCLLQTIDAFTPSANSTTFTPTLRGIQGIS